MNKIRELRMGFPKTGKTKNVVETYPAPLLLLNFEAGGPDSVSIRKVNYIERGLLVSSLKTKTPKEQWPEVTCLDLSKFLPGGRGILPSASSGMLSDAFGGFIEVVNALLDHCPFETVVVDPYTVWDGACNDYIGSMSPALLSDIKGTKVLGIPQWGLVLRKKEESINCIKCLPAHVVFIGHLNPEKNELTGEIRYFPSLTGKFQFSIGAMFSQVIVSAKEPQGQGQVKYVVYTQDSGMFKDLGGRFAMDGKSVSGPSFNEIYGGEAKK